MFAIVIVLFREKNTHAINLKNLINVIRPKSFRSNVTNSGIVLEFLCAFFFLILDTFLFYFIFYIRFPLDIDVQWEFIERR